MLSSFCSHSVSVLVTVMVLKSMYIIYSGSDDTIICPSLLSMLPLTGFTVTLSRFTLSATSSQNDRCTVIMYSARPSMMNVITRSMPTMRA